MNLKLKAMRVSKGMTQYDMACKLGISEANYNRKEKGLLLFHLDEIITILNLFDCKFEDIFLN